MSVSRVGASERDGLADGLYRRFYAGLVHPVFHALKRDGVNDALRAVMAADGLDTAALADAQRRKLVSLLRHARTHVPYYRDAIGPAAAQAIDDGHGLHETDVPVLTKSVIRERLDDLVAGNVQRDRLIANSTSGSTGEPMRFYTDLYATAWRRSVDIRNHHWLGIELGDREALLWGSQIDQQVASSLRGRLHAVVTRHCALDAYDLSESRMAAYLRRLQQFRPRLLTGYPSVLTRFGRWCEAGGHRIDSLRAIICSAEALYQDQREVVAATLHAPVYNRYGCREVGCIAHERPGAEGLAVNVDRVVIELLDDRGRPCVDGDLGHVHVTDLDSFAMPLIRYRIGDLAVAGPPAQADCPYPALNRVEGRSLDVIRTPDGRAVGGTFWTIILRSRPGLRQFQVVQEDPARLAILYVRDPAVAAPDFDHFRAGIHKTCGPTLAVEFREVGHIAAEPNGKYRIVKALAGPPEQD